MSLQFPELGVAEMARSTAIDDRRDWYVAAMEQLVDVVQQLSLAPDLDTILKIVRRSARQLVNADGATFVLRQGELSYYADEDAIGPLWKGQRFPLDSCIGGWCILHSQAVLIDDILTDDRIPIDVYQATFVKSLVMVPIRSAAPLGAIGTYWGTPHTATSEDVKLLQALANATSAAMEKIQAYIELEERVRQQQSAELAFQAERYQQAQNELLERQRAEAALRENNERLTLALEATQMGFWDWNILTNEILWSPYHERILGYEVGTPFRTYHEWRDRVHPEDLPIVEAAVQTAQETHQAFEKEYRVVHPDRSIRWVIGIGQFYYNAEGEAIRMLGMVRDITERKQLEAQFLRVQRLESLGTLASGIAHDLNNVFTPILAVAQLLPHKLTESDARTLQMLQMLDESARRGADLVRQILSFARGTEGKRMPMQVGHLLLEVVRVAKQTFPKLIEIQPDISPRTLWTVAADATQLHQVLMNLCVNARDAMPKGGTLQIQAENCTIDTAYAQMNLEAKPGSYVVISVMDSGTGIPPNILDRIFDPFFTTKELNKGTGLGLSTVLGIIKSHGGWITVYSELGKGTVFKVYLPASQEMVSPPDPSTEMLMGQGEWILVVDDETTIQEITTNALEECHYKTLMASDGIEAIAVYAKHAKTIDVVVMDLMMPVLDGLTAIRALEKINPEVKIIATSGLTSNRQSAEATGTSVKAFLPKPYTVRELLSTLHQVLHSQ